MFCKYFGHFLYLLLAPKHYFRTTCKILISYHGNITEDLANLLFVATFGNPYDLHALSIIWSCGAKIDTIMTAKNIVIKQNKLIKVKQAKVLALLHA